MMPLDARQLTDRGNALRPPKSAVTQPQRIEGGGGGGAGGVRYAVIRSIDTVTRTILAQDVRYGVEDANGNPVETGAEAFGNEYRVFPPPGHTVEQYQSMVYPTLNAAGTTQALGVRFPVVRVVKFGARLVVEPVLKMVPGVNQVDENSLPISEGSGG